jgi:hypothetical protein
VIAQGEADSAHYPVPAVARKRPGDHRPRRASALLDVAQHITRGRSFPVSSHLGSNILPHANRAQAQNGAALASPSAHRGRSIRRRTVGDWRGACSACSRLRIRMKTSATRAAASTPPAPSNAAIRLADRSGVKACKASSATATAMRVPPTMNGRGQARQTINVTAK